MHRSQAIIRTAYRFIKAKLPGLSTLTFEITTQTEDFIQDQDFLHYWRHVVPNERIAYLKGFIEGRKNANTRTGMESSDSDRGKCLSETNPQTD